MDNITSEFNMQVIESLSELKTDVKYIREDQAEMKSEIKEIRESMVTKCDTCETSNKLEEHIKNHEKKFANGWMIAGLIIANLIGFGSLLVGMFKK